MTRKQRHSSRQRKQGAPGWAWLLAVGLFAAFLVYLQGLDGTQPGLPPIPPRDAPELQPPQHPPASNESARPRFDFYTILPEMEIPDPDSGSSTPPPRRLEPSSPAPSASVQQPGAAYVLQLGSFRNRIDADRLKAKITLLGFEPHIQTATIDGSDWYRVRIGPYRNTARIAEAQHRLRENRLESILLKLKD